MELSLEDVLKGKGTRIKSNEYFETRAYVEPFIDRMSKYTDEFIVQAKLPQQITYTNDGNINTDDITYNRVYIQAVLPDEMSIANHKEVIGMVYGIDVRKPVVKFYSGGLNMACTNLCVFSPNLLNVQALESETAINYKPLNDLIHKTEEVSKCLQTLQNSTFACTEQNINESLGRWIRRAMDYSFDNGFGKVKITNSTPIDAYKYLFVDEDSPYLIKDLSEGTSMFNVYNAFTQVLTNARVKGEIMNEFEKVLLIKDILGLKF